MALSFADYNSETITRVKGSQKCAQGAGEGRKLCSPIVYQEHCPRSDG